MLGNKEAGMSDNITPTQFRESDGVDDWRVLGDGANAYFRTGSFAAGARLVQAVRQLAGGAGQGPDVQPRPDSASGRLLPISDGSGGLPPRDVGNRARV